MSLMDEVRKRQIKDINTKIFNTVPTYYRKCITQAKKGDIVVFRGGYYQLTTGRKTVIPSSSFVVGDTYECRADYLPSSYEQSFDVGRNEIKGTIQVVKDSKGSKINGWAAAYFELM